MCGILVQYYLTYVCSLYYNISGVVWLNEIYHQHFLVQRKSAKLLTLARAVLYELYILHKVIN